MVLCDSDMLIPQDVKGISCAKERVRTTKDHIVITSDRILNSPSPQQRGPDYLLSKQFASFLAAVLHPTLLPLRQIPDPRSKSSYPDPEAPSVLLWKGTEEIVCHRHVAVVRFEEG